MVAAAPIGALLGAVATSKGLSIAEVALMSTLVFAAGAQFAAILFSTLLVNARNVLMGASDFVWGAEKRAFSTRAIVTADENDQRVVELAHVVDGLNDPAYLVVGVGEISCVDICLEV
jgi:hypothetical protein